MDFGGIRALNHLDLEVYAGEIVALIGPNGAGKTTVFNCVTGIYVPTEGDVMLTQPGNDKRISLKGLKPNTVTEQGLARTFQNIRLFGNLTVWQNLWVAWRDAEEEKVGTFTNWFGQSGSRRRKIQEVLEFSDLAHRSEELASNLSFGEQRRLELARAFATKPKMILLDEPAAGMNSKEVKDLCERILTLKKMGTTVLLVEHVMELVMNVTDRITVLNFGKPIAEGLPQEIHGNPVVQEAYFGSSDKN